MVNNNHKENEKVHRKSIGEITSTDMGVGALGRAIHSEIEDPICHPNNGYTRHGVNAAHNAIRNTHSIDLGGYYIDRDIDAMEEWHSKPRDGYHVTDVCLCPRQKVFREIDRRPINAKAVSIYTVGKATHEAYQLLYRSDRRTFEIEKYVEIEDIDLYIQGSVDIYDRRRNIPLEFKTTRASDIKEPKMSHVEQLKHYMAMLDSDEGYIIYQLLMHFEETPDVRITMNSQEREIQREKLVKEVNSLKGAMEARDPSLARSVSEYPAMNWMCQDCPYQTKCKWIQVATGAMAAANFLEENKTVIIPYMTTKEEAGKYQSRQ